jgi:hypothetical protein
MNIAIIEPDKNYQLLIQDHLDNNKKNDWEIVFFDNEDEINPEQTFDAVLLDCDISEQSKVSLKQLTQKFSGILGILSAVPNFYNREGIKDQSISALIDRSNPEEILSWLKYIDARIRLNKYAEKEKQNIASNLLNLAVINNGYALDEKEGIAVLGLSKLLPDDEKEEILRKLEAFHNKVVLYFTSKLQTIYSKHLSEVIFFFTEIKKQKGMLVFWKADRDDVMTIIETCNLDKVIKVFENLDEAIAFVKNS